MIPSVFSNAHRPSAVATAFAISAGFALAFGTPAGAQTTQSLPTSVQSISASSTDTMDVVKSPRTVAIRINLAGRQRMLTQRMAKSFCYARSNVDVQKNVTTLLNASLLFDRTHRAFVDGDPEMEMFIEDDSAAVAGWTEVDALWKQLSTIYNDALNGSVVSEKTFLRAQALTSELLSKSNDLVALLRAAHSADIGRGGTGAAILIDLYGRQRMLSQKLSKDVCLAARGTALHETREELEITLELFENSLNAFIDGLPIAGVPKAPSNQIDVQLRVARNIWQPIRDIAHTVASGDSVDLRELNQFNRGMDAFLPEMDSAVKMLAELQR